MKLHCRKLMLSVISSCILCLVGVCFAAESSLEGRVESLVRRRADLCAKEDTLVVDYYRIYHRLAFNLPVRSIENPGIQVEGIGEYPWEIWLLWTLEERIYSLGWAGQWFPDRRYREQVALDLGAMAAWDRYNVESNPHLSIGHAARVLATAYEAWPWLDESLRAEIRQACYRLVEEQAAWFVRNRSQLVTSEQIRTSKEFRSILHNIPVIATLGLSMAARISGHPLRDELEDHCAALIDVELDVRNQGTTEAIGYDGYILDFVADWLRGASPEVRAALGTRPEWRKMLEEAVYLSVPGAIADYAPLNDVEPRQMPFHVSAMAKFAAMGYTTPALSWFLERYPLEVMRADGLAALHGCRLQDVQTPNPGRHDGLYAVALRTGWSAEDTAVVVSSSISPSGHIQRENGTLVIGRGGKWWIDDPGYQQYADGEERQFTLGPMAHNYPVINGSLQDRNDVRLLECDGRETGSLCTALDISGGYPEAADVAGVVRRVWMAGRDLVLVADEVRGSPESELGYTWHAPALAAVWAEKGAGLIYLDGSRFWLQNSTGPIERKSIQRIRGSRGQTSFHVDVHLTGSGGVVWWIFNFGREPASFRVQGGGKLLECEGKVFSTVP